MARKPKFPGIPTPAEDLRSIVRVLQAVKESIETGQRLRGNQLDSFVRLSELVELGVVSVPGEGVVSAGSGIGATTPELFSDASDGIVPASGGGTTNYLRADGTWAVPPGTSTTTSIATEILADSPMGYWKCDETSGTTLADSSGNSYILTLTGTYTLAVEALVPAEPTAKFIRFGTSSTSFASRAGTLGATPPLSADWSIEAVVRGGSSLLGGGNVFSMMAVGETEATNFQCSLGATTAGLIRAFWEHSAGTNNDISTTQTIPAYPGVHICAVKDGTANNVEFFVNGRSVGLTAYTNEPTGGSSALTYLGGNPTDSGCGTGVGHVAFYNSKLTAARVLAHAQAAGLFR